MDLFKSFEEWKARARIIQLPEQFYEDLCLRLKLLPKGSLVGFDVETTQFTSRKRYQDIGLLGIGLAFEKYSCYIPLGHVTNGPQLSCDEVITNLNKYLFTRKDIVKIAHNLKFDMGILSKEGATFERPYACTQIMSWLADENGPHGLKPLSNEILGMRLVSHKHINNGQLIDADMDEVSRYCRLDARATLRLFDYFRDILREEDLIDLFKWEMRVVPVVTDMETVGMRIDEEELAQLALKVSEEVKNLQKDIFKCVGFQFNTDSTANLRRILFKDLKLEPTRYTKSGEPSTDEKALEELQGQHELVDLLLEYRKYRKLQSTYTEGFKKILINGTVYGEFNQTGTYTGRFSSAKPNLQNLPRDSKEYAEFRRIFAAPEGLSMIDVDYCLVPGTRVLNTDMVWVPIETLKVGDEVVGFPEKVGHGAGHKGHLFERAKVISTKKLIRPCYRITTNEGTVTSSVEHRWLRVSGKAGVREWIETQNLKVGDKLSYWVKPWTCYGRATGLRILGWCRPLRLLSKSERLWEGRRTWGKTTPPAEIISIEYVGEQEVIALGTTTKTFLAEGFYSHNSQLELRLLAHFSQDPGLLKGFRDGIDGHTATASVMFGVPYDKVTKEQRQIAKNINFALSYGAGIKKLAMMLGSDVKFAKEMWELHHSKYRTLNKWRESMIHECKILGYVTTLLKRRRRLPEINDPNPEVSSHAERQAVNAIIQGSAADIVKAAMALLWERYRKDGLIILSQVHDEIIMLCEDGKVDYFLPLIKDTLEHPFDYELDVPLVVDPGVGKNWSEAKV